MTSHELANILLVMPDLPIVIQDGGDPSDPKVVELVRLSSDRYFNEVWYLCKDQHIELH